MPGDHVLRVVWTADDHPLPAGAGGLRLLVVAWNLALLRELWTRSAWLTAALAATLALGLQTDVIGVHWLAVVLWGLCGAAIGREYDREP